jgi:hypothetical protein
VFEKQSTLRHRQHDPVLEQVRGEHNRRAEKDGKGRELLEIVSGRFYRISIFLFQLHQILPDRTKTVEAEIHIPGINKPFPLICWRKR